MEKTAMRIRARAIRWCGERLKELVEYIKILRGATLLRCALAGHRNSGMGDPRIFQNQFKWSLL
ncbi:MAG: hypothetical protein KTR25_12640 [Myxococcales bacterium]|nr:hypothetical protein [Myxococcales bacterium]